MEVYGKGVWGTICNEAWDVKDAEVVCRALGLPAPVDVPAEMKFPQGSGRVLLSKLNCNGSENSLEECAHGGWGQNNCTHEQDVGVVCSNETEGNF